MLTALPLIAGLAAAAHLAFVGAQSDARDAALTGRLLERAGVRALAVEQGLDALAQVGRSAAAYLSANPWPHSKKTVYSLLRAALGAEPGVQAATIAFLPYAFDGRQRLYAPHVHRTQEALEEYNLVARGYDYGEEEAWFRLALASGGGVWVGPAQDSASGGGWVVRHATPFFEKGQPRGVVAVDVDVGRLRALPGVYPGDGARFVLVDSSGRFVSHPDPSFVGAESLSGLSERMRWPELAQLGTALSTGQIGVVRLSRFDVPEPHWVYFAPIADSGWMYAAAVPEELVDRDGGGAVPGSALLFVGVALLVLVGWLSAIMRTTRPLARLSAALRELALKRGLLGPEELQGLDEIGTTARVVAGLDRALTERQAECLRLAAERDTRGMALAEAEATLARRQDIGQGSTIISLGEELGLCAQHIPGTPPRGETYEVVSTTGDALLLMLIGPYPNASVPLELTASLRDRLRRAATLGETPQQLAALIRERAAQEPTLAFCMARYEPATSQIRLVNRGQPWPLRTTPDGMVEPLVAHSTQAEESCATLNEGDTALFYANGLEGAAENPEGVVRRLAAALGARRPEPLDLLCRRVMQETREAQCQACAGDLTWQVLQRRGKTAPARSGAMRGLSGLLARGREPARRG